MQCVSINSPPNIPMNFQFFWFQPLKAQDFRDIGSIYPLEFKSIRDFDLTRDRQAIEIIG